MALNEEEKSALSPRQCAVSQVARYSNEEVITETNAYFEAKDKSFYKKGIEMLEKHWTDCVAFEGDYVDEYIKSSFAKKCVFPS